MEYKTKCCNPANMGATRGSAKIDWIVIHYTSNLGDTAKNNADYFAREKLSYKASAHFFVDENEIWSSVSGISHGISLRREEAEASALPQQQQSRRGNLHVGQACGSAERQHPQGGRAGTVADERIQR